MTDLISAGVQVSATELFELARCGTGSRTGDLLLRVTSDNPRNHPDYVLLRPPGMGGSAYPEALYKCWLNMLHALRPNSPFLQHLHMELSAAEVAMTRVTPLLVGETVQQYHDDARETFLQVSCTAKGYVVWMDALTFGGDYGMDGGVLLTPALMDAEAWKFFTHAANILTHPTVRALSARLEANARAINKWHV